MTTNTKCFACSRRIKPATRLVIGPCMHCKQYTCIACRLPESHNCPSAKYESVVVKGSQPAPKVEKL